VQHFLPSILEALVLGKSALIASMMIPRWASAKTCLIQVMAQNSVAEMDDGQPNDTTATKLDNGLAEG
jgi:hypothetical protein